MHPLLRGRSLVPHLARFHSRTRTGLHTLTHRKAHTNSRVRLRAHTRSTAHVCIHGPALTLTVPPSLSRCHAPFRFVCCWLAHTNVDVCTHTYAHTYTHTHTHTHAGTHSTAHAQTHMHTHTHTDTHTQRYMYKHGLPRSHDYPPASAAPLLLASMSSHASVRPLSCSYWSDRPLPAPGILTHTLALAPFRSLSLLPTRPRQPPRSPSFVLHAG